MAQGGFVPVCPTGIDTSAASAPSNTRLGCRGLRRESGPEAKKVNREKPRSGVFRTLANQAQPAFCSVNRRQLGTLFPDHSRLTAPELPPERTRRRNPTPPPCARPQRTGGPDRWAPPLRDHLVASNLPRREHAHACSRLISHRLGAEISSRVRTHDGLRIGQIPEARFRTFVVSWLHALDILADKTRDRTVRVDADRKFATCRQEQP
jgi:hypothetical protein